MGPSLGQATLQAQALPPARSVPSLSRSGHAQHRAEDAADRAEKAGSTGRERRASAAALS